MKILSIDTSTQVGSVAIMDDEKICVEISYQTKSSHAEVLMNEIDKALKKSGLVIGDVDGIAVAIGPGSFTGLRIGLATAKGLAIATGKPIIGVSSLEALALAVPLLYKEGVGEVDTLPPLTPPYKGGEKVTVIPCINAYRGEVYAAAVSLSPRGRGEGEGEKQIIPECSITPEALCDLLLPPPSNSLLRQKAGGQAQGEGGLQQHPLLLFIGDGAIHYKDLFKEKLGKRFNLAKGDEFPIAVEVGLLSFPKFKEGQVSDIITLAPNYIRKTDAEIKKSNHRGHRGLQNLPL